jgi:fibrillarin-like rRNA methylase
MKNIKSIILTLTIVLLLGYLLPTTTTHATTLKTTNQNATLQCCKIAYNKLLDFTTQRDTLTPLQDIDANIYNAYINVLEAQGTNFNDISNILIQSRYR